MDKERRDWLLSIDKKEAANLSRIDWYDRLRILREKIAYDVAKSFQDRHSLPFQEKTSPRPYNSSKVGYRNFSND